VPSYNDIMDSWCPWATRDVVFPDAGSYVGGPFRGVLHTTEGSNYAGARGAYVATHNGPHFTVAADGVWQHVALDRAATALAHPAGTVATNRLSAVQIEIVGFASHPEQLPLAQVKRLMVWIEQQTGIAAVAPKFLPYPQSAGASTVRFGSAMWARFGGWCGHQHVPSNDHGDPGAIDTTFLLQRGVSPMFSPPLSVAAWRRFDFDGHNGLIAVGPDGAIFCEDGAMFHGGANGQPYFAGRGAAHLDVPNANEAGKHYVIVDTAGERYAY
jgi:hypothetical protein